jgi:FAD/FMN-containing dehydrogenase
MPISAVFLSLRGVLMQLAHHGLFFAPNPGADARRVICHHPTDRCIRTGVGIGKSRFMKMEHGIALDVMRQVKQTLDPNWILNPRKIFP